MPCLSRSGCLVRSGSSFTGCDVVRSLRAFLFLCVGLCLGGLSVAAFAQASSYGSSINFNYPNGLNPRRAQPPLYDFQSAPDGWGKMRDINKVGLGGKVIDITGTRLFSPGALAATARGAARFLGPLGLGLTLAELVWDESQGWLIPGDEETGEAAPSSGGYTLVGPVTDGNGVMSCRQALGDILLASMGGFWGETPQDLFNRINAHAVPSFECSGNVWTFRAASTGFTTSQRVRVFYEYGGFSQDIRIGYSVKAICESGERLTATGRCVNPTRPATDAELEDAIYAELVARGIGSELARRLIEAGYKPEVDSVEVDGPSSVPGDTVTSTTSGPAGTTTTVTNTTHNLSYNTNNTTNTSTVTITNTTTTTTTAPDGSVTTETATETPAEGEAAPPPEEPKPFCELYPDASACAKLDVPAVDPNQSEDVTVTLTPTGGFGSEAGSCPPPFPFVVQGRSYQISYAQACDFFSAVRPVVIAAAMLSALLIALGGYKRD